MKPSVVQEYIESLKSYKTLAPDIVCHRSIPARSPKYAEMADADYGPAGKIYHLLGIKRLYHHQKQAIDQIGKQIHTVIATPTASGKSLVYNLPVINNIIKNPASKALYLFPLKALARDQLDALRRLLSVAKREYPHCSGISADVYDGDLSSYRKSRIRQSPPNMLLTNPEMLHLAMLPHHGLWEEFFKNLRYIVVDEVHTYRGVMGSHMAWVFRRLIRICDYYGSKPVFIFCSATISNPRELASGLTGLDVVVVDGNSAPSGEKEVLLMNGMAGAAQTAIQLMHAAIHRGIRTIVYAQSRKITELIAMWASERAGKLAEKISAYRAGFLPEERREIEEGLSSGELLAVVSTSALELGIDIGNLDLCILVGYPGSIMSTWQRAGRVGRDGSQAAVVFIAHEDALDHYFMQNPDVFFTMPPETAVINPQNPVIMERQLECAAADLSLHCHEPLLENESVRHVLEILTRDVRLLRSRDGNIWYSARKAPHRDVSLRGSGRSIPIFTDGGKKSLGDIDWYRAFYETHEGAVYIHHGETYVVEAFDYEHGIVDVIKKQVNYFTRARSNKSTQIVRTEKSRMLWGTRVGFGKLKVTDQVTGFEKKLTANHRSLGIRPLDLPPVTFETQGLWIEIPDTVRETMESQRFHFMGGIHALEHAAIGILPLIVMADRNDLGGISIPYHPQTRKAAIFIYDGTPGGIGLAEQAFEAAQTVLERTFDTIGNCRCDHGCPRCVHSPKCGSGNRPIDKEAAVKILEQLKHDTGTETFEVIQESATESEGYPDSKKDPVKSEILDFRFGVLDIETRRSAEEVGGWQRADRMGVSCAVLYDSKRDSYQAYSQEEIPELDNTLTNFNLIIGFNILRFDYHVLSGLSNFNYPELPTLDILDVIYQRLGYRLSLDNLASTTLDSKKSADGLMALKWWKQGKLKEIIEYCTQDVKVTRDLYLFGRDEGFLLFTNKAKHQVRVPVSW